MNLQPSRLQEEKLLNRLQNFLDIGWETDCQIGDEKNVEGNWVQADYFGKKFLGGKISYAFHISKLKYAGEITLDAIPYAKKPQELEMGWGILNEKKYSGISFEKIEPQTFIDYFQALSYTLNEMEQIERKYLLGKLLKLKK